MLRICNFCQKEFKDTDIKSEAIYEECSRTGLCEQCIMEGDVDEYNEYDDEYEDEESFWDDYLLAEQEQEDFAQDDDWSNHVVDWDDYPY